MFFNHPFVFHSFAMMHKPGFKAILSYTYTRGPWTATPALIKVEEREQNKKHLFFKKHGIIKSMRIFKSTQ